MTKLIIYQYSLVSFLSWIIKHHIYLCTLTIDINFIYLSEVFQSNSKLEILFLIEELEGFLLFLGNLLRSCQRNWSKLLLVLVFPVVRQSLLLDNMLNCLICSFLLHKIKLGLFHIHKHWLVVHFDLISVFQLS